MGRWKEDTTERFEKFTIPVTESGCHLWIGSTLKGGYGKFTVGGKTVLAHRFSFQRIHGSLTPQQCLDHLCRVRCCVNPEHLELVTQQENLLRGHTLAAANVAKTCCPKGHGYTVENTYYSDGHGRDCRICRYEANRRFLTKKGKKK